MCLPFHPVLSFYPIFTISPYNYYITHMFTISSYIYPSFEQMTMNRSAGGGLDTEDSSDLDEPMASQSADHIEGAPLTHNSSKNNFFNPEEMNTGTGSSSAGGAAVSAGTQVIRGSFKNTSGPGARGESPNYQGKYNPQYVRGSPHPTTK